MVFFNHATRQMTTKLVYYGPGLCGKTTNLNTIYARTSQKARGEMVSLNTETDRTLFFDLLPMDVGMVGGFRTKLQLYTVPGQVFYNSTRKLVLKGVDGIVFVADSQMPMLDANRESLENLRDNLRELGLQLQDIPLVFQWNKRDLKNIVPVDVLERELNPSGLSSFQSIASDGTGVFETLRGITRLALGQIKALHMADAPAPVRPPEAVLPPDDTAMDATSTRDLPPPLRSSGDAPTLGGVESSLGTGVPGQVQVMAPLRVKLAPSLGKPAPAFPRIQLKTPPLVPPKAATPVAKAAHLAMPKAPVVRPHADLHLVLPIAVLDGDLEVVVSVRQGGREVCAGSAVRQAPPLGGGSHLILELKRS